MFRFSGRKNRGGYSGLESAEGGVSDGGVVVVVVVTVVVAVLVVVVLLECGGEGLCGVGPRTIRSTILLMSCCCEAHRVVSVVRLSG